MLTTGGSAHGMMAQFCRSSDSRFPEQVARPCKNMHQLVEDSHPPLFPVHSVVNESDYSRFCSCP